MCSVAHHNGSDQFGKAVVYGEMWIVDMDVEEQKPSSCTKLLGQYNTVTVNLPKTYEEQGNRAGLLHRASKQENIGDSKDSLS